MTTNTYPRLCGGTFFTLVLQALQQRIGARQHYDGYSDGLTDPEVLVGLIRVIHPAYRDPGKEALKATVNNYKFCKTANSAHFPFDDDQVLSAFNDTVQNNYPAALDRMNRFVNRFLDTSEPAHKDVNLVRALVDLIQQDQSIAADEAFCIEPNGSKKKKAALGDLKRVCLPSFLLGVWHYVMMNREDNTVGKQTCDVWCPSNYGAQRKYTAHMGRGILCNLTVYSLDIEGEDDLDEPDEGDVIDDEPVEVVVMEDAPNPPTQQTVNNPFVFNFNQYGNNGTQIGHIENYYAGKRKEDRGNE